MGTVPDAMDSGASGDMVREDVSEEVHVVVGDVCAVWGDAVYEGKGGVGAGGSEREKVHARASERVSE